MAKVSKDCWRFSLVAGERLKTKCGLERVYRVVRIVHAAALRFPIANKGAK
jgi:hypothetical protein